MITNLRDLEADRRWVTQYEQINVSTKERELRNIAIAALDEIDRLKGLLVSEQDGWFYVCMPFTCKPDDDCEPWCNEKGFIGWRFRNANHAWAAVRKAACCGK